jgi:rare lipoprotein A (peptidoglycan hydrolase)
VIGLLLSLVLAFTPGCQVKTAHGIPVSGTASWYDATYTPKHGNGGQTTWYTRKGYVLYAAVGTFRWGDKPYGLKVCRADDRTRCVQVTVVDRCSRCRADLKKPWTSRSRNIDLSPAAFSQLRGLQFGVLQVILTEYNLGGR